MLRNHLTIAWRNIVRNRIYTTINVIGLALGICACIVIYLATSYDLSFDKFHPDRDQIYRFVGEIQREDGEKNFANSPFEDVAGFQNKIPGFQSVAGIHLFRCSASIINPDKTVKKFDTRIEGAYGGSTVITWPEYFDIFKYKWLIGNAKTSLNDPYKVVLSEKRAHKYFGDIPLNEMIGKTVAYDDSVLVSVSGIVKDWEEKTDFGYTDFISIGTVKDHYLNKQIATDDWRSLNPHRSMAFVKLEKNTKPAEINARFAAFIKEHVKVNNAGTKITMWLQPLNDIHFTKAFQRGDDGDDFRKAYMPVLYLLMGLAAFILLIAAFNFINLSTAQSVQRTKEIGIRKVLGSNKARIMLQFLVETALLTLFAVVIASLLVNPVLTAFSAYLPQGVVFKPFQFSSLIFLTAVTVITTLLAGFYPAKMMAAYLPVTSLKGATAQRSASGINLRKSLIVFQFTMSLVFIIATLVVDRQIKFMTTAEKGFNTDAIITVNNWDDHEGKLKVFADNIRHLGGVANTLVQGTAPMGFAQNIDNYKYKGSPEKSFQVLADIGNSDFVTFYGMKIIAGRNVLSGDSLRELLINETFSRSLGFTNPRDVIGKLLYQQAQTGEKAIPIAGVVADYHTGSFHEMIRPVIIENVPERKTSVAIKLTADEKNVQQVKVILAKIETEWKKIFPDKAFEYSFLNESISWLFDQERKTIWLMNIAMAVTIFISCMGLFGLGMFTAERRTKEIGIRKVLGASVSNIALMLGKDFVILVLIAIVIASPIAWYLMNSWLADFVYRTTISWWIFTLAGLMAVFIAMFTISFQAIRAAVANPIVSLRSE